MNWNNLTSTIRTMIANGQAKEILAAGIMRTYSDRRDYLLRRDLSAPIDNPPAKIPVRVRPLAEPDIPIVAAEVPDRLAALKSGLPTCYLGVTENDEICYMQWLIGPSHNHLRPRNIGLTLEPDERLLEWAYTFKRFRGLGIMPCAMSVLVQRAAETGARWLYTVVEENNIPSLKGCRAVGFRPYKLRTERWRLMHLTQSYAPLPDGAKYSFES